MKDRKFGLKHIVGFNLITVVAAVILTATIVTASFTVYNLYLDALPYTDTYTIEADGSGNYRAIKYNGQVLWDSTNASYTIQSSLNSMPNGGSVGIAAGNFTVDTTIDYTYNHTYIEGRGVGSTILTLADNVNNNMFNITNKDFVGLSNLRINGNQGQQTAGNGIRIYSSENATAWSGYYIDNVQIYNFKENGIYSGGSYPGDESRYADKSFITRCIISQNGGSGIKIENYGWEWKIIGNTIDRNGGHGIFLVGSAEHIIQGNHIWENQHGIVLYTSTTYAIEITGNEIGPDNYLHGMYIYGDTANTGPANLTITGNTIISNSKSGAGSYSGIYIANSTWLLITGNHLTDPRASPTQGWGLEEVSGDYNVIVSNIAIGNTVGGITVTGANTKVNLSYNGTSWIA